jgi:hypothetical protein
MTQVFLYRETAKLTPEDLKALREAGLVPVKVAKFEDVRIIDPLLAAGHGSAVWAAAVEAIAKANTPAANNEGARTLFGRLLAEKLADATVFNAAGRPHGA